MPKAQEIAASTQLSDKLFFINVAEKFLDFIKDSKAVIHNAKKFDLGFLKNHELDSVSKKTY